LILEETRCMPEPSFFNFLHFRFFISGLVTIFIFTAGCIREEWEISYRQAAKMSLLPNVDLILIPQNNSLIDDRWLSEAKMTTYHLPSLKKQFLRYGKSWEEFLKQHKKRICIEGDTIQIAMESTSHYTNYDYDRNIPILFYGDRFFKKGIYREKIFQQHIVPTIAHILESPLPDGAILPPLQHAIHDEWNEKKRKNPTNLEIVLTIVIDQGGLQYYNAHPRSFPNIKRLMENSAYFPNAQIGHLEAHTAVGHVAIGTGAFPKQTEIIANERKYVAVTMSDAADSPVQIAVQSRKVFESGQNLISPADMKVETLADVWDRHRNNLPIIISQCYASRASIGMAGHGSFLKGGDKDYVYWLDKKTMSWITSPSFFQIPAIASEFNVAEYNRKYNTNPWWSSEKLPDNQFFSKKFNQTVATPIQAMLEGELFRKVLERELIQTQLGKDGETDLLYITLKATDAVGHLHGWESEEARLVLEETDRQVGLIWKMLEDNWRNQYILILTADHGAAPLREFSGGLYLPFDEFLKEVQSLLPETVREKESLIHFFTSSMVSLNHEVMEKYGISEYRIIQKILQIEVDGRKFFRKVFTRKDLEP